MAKGDPVNHLHKVLGDSEYLADLFHILHFDEVEVPLTATSGSPILLVPECIDELFTNRSTESQDLIAALLLWARPTDAPLAPAAISDLVGTIRSRYLAFREVGQVRPIPDEANTEILEVLRQLLPDQAPRGSLIDRMTQTVRKSVTTILSVSKRTGQGILMRGRDLSRLLRDRVSQLELPAKADALVERKAALTSRLFAFKGGRATKFFVGAALGTAGLFTAGAPVAVAGLLFAFVDP